jgi:hypothetical protein
LATIKAGNRGLIAAYNKKYKRGRIKYTSGYNKRYFKKHQTAIQKRSQSVRKARVKIDSDFNLTDKLRAKFYSLYETGSYNRKEEISRMLS